MRYDKRNKENLMKLADNTRVAALNWYGYCLGQGADILIYETIRTKEQQKENVAKGASQTMKSYHIVGQALDFVPVNSKGEALWSGSAYETTEMRKIIAEAKRLGFEWGGDWKSFVDKPHLQYNYKGYGTDTFGQKVVSLKEEFKLSKVQEKAVNRLVGLSITDKANLDKTMSKADICVMFDRMLEVLEDKRGGYDYKLEKE